MGKVYEALARAEAATRKSAGALDYDEAASGLSDEDDFFGASSEADIEMSPDLEGESFSFLRYSLGASSAIDRARSKRETAVVKRPAMQPAREMTIDPNRIDPHLAVFFNHDRRANEQYNRLALTLISKAAERGIKRVLIASPEKGDGRTTVTLNLACALARARQRVLVVDCNLAEPAVGQMLGVHSDTGMVEAFTAQMAPGAAAIRVLPYGFNILPTSRRIENPVEIIAAPGFWKMLQAFDADHDFILIDSPPLLAMGDSSLLIRFTDATLMVLRAGATSSAQMAKAITPFSQDDILGVALNRFTE